MGPFKFVSIIFVAITDIISALANVVTSFSKGVEQSSKPITNSIVNGAKTVEKYSLTMLDNASLEREAFESIKGDLKEAKIKERKLELGLDLKKTTSRLLDCELSEVTADKIEESIKEVENLLKGVTLTEEKKEDKKNG